jgi:adenylate cyclase
MQGDDRIEAQQSSIDEFLRKRAEIEQTIRDRFQREITVMFTDIVSSAEFHEIHGDTEGRSMIQRHHDLLSPIVEKHGGRVLRAMGEGLMATFENPPDAARAAAEIQRTLAEENRGKNPSEQIWVKAAIHHGLGIVEAGDVYGDMVNTLARICALTRKGDVLVSQAFVDLVKEQSDTYFDYVRVKNLKEKAVPVEVYRIVWEPAQVEDLKRSPERS